MHTYLALDSSRHRFQFSTRPRRAGFRTSLIRGSRKVWISVMVWSVEKSSTTMSSKSVKVCFSTLVMASLTYLAPLYVGMQTVTLGCETGLIIDPTVFNTCDLLPTFWRAL